MQVRFSTRTRVISYRDFKLIVFEAMCHSAKCTSASIYDVLILYYYIHILRV